MVFNGSSVSSLDRFFGGVEVAEVNLGPVERYTSAPFLGRLVPVDAFDTGAASGWPVGVVLRVVGKPEVRDSVVVFQSIDVVDLFRRPLSVNPEPSEPVSVMESVSDADVSVALLHQGAGRFAGVTGVPFLGVVGAEQPREDASLRIVRQLGLELVERQCDGVDSLFHVGLYAKPAESRPEGI